MNLDEVRLAWRLGPACPLSLNGERAFVDGYGLECPRFKPTRLLWVNLTVQYEDGACDARHLHVDPSVPILTRGAKVAMAKARKEDDEEARLREAEGP